MRRSVGVSVVLVLVLVVAVAAVAGAVEFAARAQETSANTNFLEAQNATDMSVAMLEQERGLDGFAPSGRPAELQPYFAGEGRFSTDLSGAFTFSSNDSIELALVRQQQAIERKWQTSTALGRALRRAWRSDGFYWLAAAMFLRTTSLVLAASSVGLNSTTSVPSNTTGVCPGGA